MFVLQYLLSLRLASHGDSVGKPGEGLDHGFLSVDVFVLGSYGPISLVRRDTGGLQKPQMASGH